MRKLKCLLVLVTICGSIATKAQLIPYYSSVTEKYGYKDTHGKEVVPAVYELAYPFSDGMAAVRLMGKYGYLDEAGKVVVPPKYDFTWKFIGGYATVKLQDKFGFIDKMGREVVPLVYEDANNFHGACCYKLMAHVREKGKWKILRLK